MVTENDDARYAALAARDRRFDGVFYVAVHTTGIYCRPICPAKTPGRTRCAFYPTAALAEKAGFRACFRCRPELAPGNAEVDSIDQLVRTAAARIAEGALNAASVAELATELGVSERHMRRATEARLGVSPVELAQTARVALAKQLLQDTAMPVTTIAFAAGFGSVRRFNAAFKSVMKVAPRDVRRTNGTATVAGITLRLDYRPPYDWGAILAFLAARAIPGVEHVAGERYARVVHLDGAVAAIEVSHDPARDALVLAVGAELVGSLMPLVVRVRRMFDLDARPDVIAGVLARDPRLAPHVAARPGLRVPGAIDPFEAAIRAMLGQQVSVAAATTLAGRFAARFGSPLAVPVGPLTHRFPTAAEVARATVDAIAKVGLPGKRAAAIQGLAVAIVNGTLDLGAKELDRFVAAAIEMPGIGPWTAHYLAMRALHLPDAFPAGDLGVKNALGLDARAAEAYATCWRPFRSYAVLHLWTGAHDDRPRHDDPRLPARRAAPVRARRSPGRPVPAGADRAGRAGGARRGARARRRAARRVLRG